METRLGIYIYIYIERERERYVKNRKEKKTDSFCTKKISDDILLLPHLFIYRHQRQTLILFLQFYQLFLLTSTDIY